MVAPFISSCPFNEPAPRTQSGDGLISGRWASRRGTVQRGLAASPLNGLLTAAGQDRRTDTRAPGHSPSAPDNAGHGQGERGRERNKTRKRKRMTWENSRSGENFFQGNSRASSPSAPSLALCLPFYLNVYERSRSRERSKPISHYRPGPGLFDRASPQCRPGVVRGLPNSLSPALRGDGEHGAFCRVSRASCPPPPAVFGLFTEDS